MDVTPLQSLGAVSLTIPAWQMAVFVGIMSVFLLLGRLQLCLLTTYVFVLYWGFVLYAPSFIGAAGGDTAALVVYLLCGLAVTVLTIVAFFKQPAK